MGRKQMLSYRQNSVLLPFLVGFLTAWVLSRYTSSTKNIPPDVLQILSSPQAQFQGTQYWKPGVTQKATTLYQTKFARFQLHQILLEDGKTVVDDWMWFDESDNINVLVETPQKTYLVFQQNKYGIDGESYAIVGGLVEPGEQPLAAAQREVKEELGMTASEWIFLKSYRAAANRGGGTTYCFVAKNAIGQLPTSQGRLAEGESERQSRIQLTRMELIQAVMEGKFKEVKWTATVALALLRDYVKEKDDE